MQSYVVGARKVVFFSRVMSEFILGVPFWNRYGHNKNCVAKFSCQDFSATLSGALEKKKIYCHLNGEGASKFQTFAKDIVIKHGKVKTTLVVMKIVD